MAAELWYDTNSESFPGLTAKVVQFNLAPLVNYSTLKEVFMGLGLNIEPQIKARDDIREWSNQSVVHVEQLKSSVANPASKVIQGVSQKAECCLMQVIWHNAY